MDHLTDLEPEVKIIIVGNGAVGKTSMIRRFCKGEDPDAYKKTIGVDYAERRDYPVDAFNESVTLHIWDTAGQEEYANMTNKYYRDAGGCVLAFSTTDDASFKAVASWKKRVDEHCEGIPMVIVQNKMDLAAEAKMKPSDVEALASELGLKLFRSSVKDNTNVNEVFDELCEAYFRRKKQAAATAVAESAQKEKAKPAEKSTVDPAKPKNIKAKEKKGFFSRC